MRFLVISCLSLLETYEQVFFPFSQSSFLSFLISFFFSECETQSERETYCLHGGTCFRVPSENSGPQCHCTEYYAGFRCMYQYATIDE